MPPSYRRVSELQGSHHRPQLWEVREDKILFIGLILYIWFGSIQFIFTLHLRNGSPKNENYSMIYLPVSHPRYIQISSFWRIQSGLHKKSASVHQKCIKRFSFAVNKTWILHYAVRGLVVDLVNWGPQANIGMGPYTFAHIFLDQPWVFLFRFFVVMLAAAQWCPVVVLNISIFYFSIIFHVRVIMGFFH